MAPRTHDDLQVAVAVEVAAGRRGEHLVIAEGGAGMLRPPPLGEGRAPGVEPVHEAAVAADEDLHRPVAVAVHGQGRPLDIAPGVEDPADAAVGVDAIEVAVAVSHQYLLAPVPVDVGKGRGGVLEDAAHVEHPFLPPLRRGDGRAGGIAGEGGAPADEDQGDQENRQGNKDMSAAHLTASHSHISRSLRVPAPRVTGVTPGTGVAPIPGKSE